jgi:methylenetetrahydrofolate reductase (NADPH)
VTSLIDQPSLEMTVKDVPVLAATRQLIEPGTEVSITFLPGESRDARVDAAAAVRHIGMTPVPHIAARRISSSVELDAFLEGLSHRGRVDRVFVVAGDAASEPEGPFEDALALIRSGRLARYGIRKVGITGYPEGHPSIPETQLWQALTQKHEALTALGHSCEIVTQFSFDAEAVLRWLAQLREERIATPVKIGIPGPASVKSLLRFAARCGVGASTRVMAKYGLSLSKLLSSTGPESLIEELAANLDPQKHGEVRLHLYAFGGLERTAQWAHDFRASCRQRIPAAPSATSRRLSGS